MAEETNDPLSEDRVAVNLGPRDGGYFIVLDGERMCVGGLTAPLHLETTVRQAARITGEVFVYQVHYVDCARCRKDRLRYADQEELARARSRDTYWCNDCQATGLVPEPPAAANARYRIRTWEQVVREMSPEAFAEELTRPRPGPHERRAPHGTLLAEARTRLLQLPTEMTVA